MPTKLPPCFKAYDIRGRVPDELNDGLAEGIGRAMARLLRRDRNDGAGADSRLPDDPLTVAVGRDVRLSSPDLQAAVIKGLTAAGANVVDIGQCGTEMVYFAVFSMNFDGGIMVTASHNPMDYNGLKLVRAGARPISGDSGLQDLGLDAVSAVSGTDVSVIVPGTVTTMDLMDPYIEHLLSYVDRAALSPLRIVFDAGNGCAGPVVRRLIQELPLEAIEVRFEPDGNFPSGIPNPLLPGNRMVCADEVSHHRADLGVAFDGDFDRCFFFDGNGDFVEGYYLVGLLAEQALRDSPGGRILHDPRLVWNTVDQVRAAGGIPVMSKTGHAFMKERLRAEDAIYGGEMSAHHYFRRFGYCDSGMIPWLLVAAHLSRTGLGLAEILRERIERFPCSGEINRTVKNVDRTVAHIRSCFAQEALAEDHTDGLSFEFREWRFNVRGSNTEPFLRLNVETRGDKNLLEAKTREVLAAIEDGATLQPG